MNKTQFSQWVADNIPDNADIEIVYEHKSALDDKGGEFEVVWIIR